MAETFRQPTPEDLTPDEYRAKLREGELSGQNPPEDSAGSKLILPGQSESTEQKPGIEIVQNLGERRTYGEVKLDEKQRLEKEEREQMLQIEQTQRDAKKKAEDARRMEEDKQVKVTDRRGQENTDMGSIHIFGAPEAKPSAGPKNIIGAEQPAPAEQKPGIEIVQNFGERRTPQEATYGKNMVKGVAERRDVREQILRGEIPSAVELAKLSANERPEKKETQEAVVVRTGEQQIKAEAEAKKQLEDRLIEIKGIRPASEQERVANVEEASRIYEQLQKGDLKAATEAKARENAAQDGTRIMTKQEFLARENDPAKMEQRMTKIRQRQSEQSLKLDWQLSQENPERPGVKRYDSYDDFKKAIDAKKAELAQNGITMPDGVMEELINQGIRVDDIKIKKAWFGFGKAKTVEIPTIPLMGQEGYKKPRTISYKPEELASMAARYQEGNNRRDREDAEFEIDRVLAFGQRAWKNKKHEAQLEVLREAADEIQEERKPKPEEVKPVEAVAEKPKPKFEIFDFGKRRTPEQQKEMEKIRKQFEADIERRKKNRKELMDLISAQKKGQLLTARQLSHLRNFATEEMMKEAA